MTSLPLPLPSHPTLDPPLLSLPTSLSLPSAPFRSLPLPSHSCPSFPPTSSLPPRPPLPPRFAAASASSTPTQGPPNGPKGSTEDPLPPLTNPPLPPTPPSHPFPPAPQVRSGLALRRPPHKGAPNATPKGTEGSAAAPPRPGPALSPAGDVLLLLAEPEGRANSFVGTEEYLAPEVCYLI